MTTQVFVASTAFGLATLSAAISDGAFEEVDRRILLVSCHSAMPEATPSILEFPGADVQCDRFDSVYDYNDAIEPQHPMAWAPRAADLTILSRHFRALWQLGQDSVHLVVESIQGHPARALCAIFEDARIDVYADGLMSYGPTRTALPATIGSRIERLLHLDLVPGLTPMLLCEWSVPPVTISSASMRSVITEMVAAEENVGTENTARTMPSAMVVGQYLSTNAVLTDAEEVDLYCSMIKGCAAEGFRRVIFKPHPSAPTGQLNRLKDVAADFGLGGSQDRDHRAATFARREVDLIVGCFSTALMTATSIYGLPIARYGTELLLERLTPYENSNRIPVTILDVQARELATSAGGSRPTEPLPSAAELNALIVAVSYAMQPELHADRRPEAAEFLATHPLARARYVKRRRLARLALPGSPSPSKRGRAVLRRIARPLGATVAAAFGASRGKAT